MKRVELIDEQLLEAIKSDNANKCIELLNQGANVNTSDNDGATPLHYASRGGHAELCRVLLAHGADVNAKTNTHRTPLHLAIYEEYTEICLTLLAHGAEVNAMHLCGLAPLHIAALNERVPAFLMLLDHGADLKLKNKNGKTARDLVIQAGCEPIIAALRARDAYQSAMAAINEINSLALKPTI